MSSSASSHAFLAGGGAMGALIRAHDWSKTAIGSVETWSPALRMQVSFLLANRFPMLLWWGPTFCSIYNDAYAPILGAKHPWALGKPVSECWSEIWDVLRPLIETPFQGGPPTWIEDFQLELRRHGYFEEGHFTVAYSPVPDETAPRGIGGVVATVHEISATVFAERRVAALRDLGSRAGEARTAEQACAIAAETLAAYSKDLPFVLLYLVAAPGETDAKGRTARLAGAAGATAGDDIAPVSVALDGTGDGGWPLAEAARDEAVHVAEHLHERFARVPRGPWHDPPDTGVVLAIPSSKPHEPAGLLVAGVSSRLRLDEHYRDFLELLRTQVATAIASARAYEEEKKRAEALAAIDRAKTAFFSNVSHEFRTPLTLMLGPVEELLSRSYSELSPAAKEQLEVVNRNGLRLLRLVNTLLDFSRIEAGRVRAVFQPTDLAAFTTELAGVFRSAIERAGMRLTVDCPPLAVPVFVDRDMWEQVVLNLLSNAFKFTFEGGITIALRQTETAAELRVTDTGTGIPAAEMPRLFERFHRVENARGRTHEGSGIGLALVQELVKIHGGSIGAESTVGEGTAFTIRVPLGSEHLPPEQLRETRAPTSASARATPFVEEALRWLPGHREGDAEAELPGKYDPLPVPAPAVHPGLRDERPRVLVADDNADMCQYVVRLLAERYRVVAVPDGEAALAEARREPPDLVLTDVMMPQLDGFGLLRELRADPTTRDVPVILLSARAGEESRVEGLSAGSDDYLVKPFSARELQARVAAHLEMARVRRKASEALREQERALNEAQRLAHVGSWQWDLATGEQLFSDELCRLLGWSMETPIPPFDEQDGLFYAHEQWVLLESAVQKAVLTGEGWSLELQGLRAGEPFWLTTRGEVVRGDDGSVVALRGTVQDITERKALELERHAVLERERDARAAAERLARLKDDFLATLSHELRNPLNAVLGWAQFLKKDATDPAKVLNAADVIYRNTRVQVQLISDLLDLSRIGAGKVELDVQRVDLPVVIEAAVQSMLPTAEARGIRLCSVVVPGTGVVRGDPARLQQVIWNLLSNAVKFTPRGGEVRVELATKNERAEIHVNDTGDGIAPEFLPHLFERFRQADASASRQHGGLGIGLALVKQLVDLHGGEVRVHSAGKGRGSLFVVELLLAGADSWLEPRRPPLEVAAQASARLKGVRALVVDDEQDALALVRRILEESQATVGTALSADEALRALESGEFDLLISDIGMPGRDGYDLAREMRSRGILIPAVALTAFARAEDRAKALRSGYQAHVTKPVNAVELLTTVAALSRKVRETSVEPSEP